MTWSDLLSYYPHVLTAGGLFVSYLLLRARGEFATRPELAALSADVAKVAQRVEIMDREMQHLPRREDIHALHLKLSEVQGSLGEMRAEARGDRDLLARVEAVMSRHEDIIAATGRAGARG